MDKLNHMRDSASKHYLAEARRTDRMVNVIALSIVAVFLVLTITVIVQLVLWYAT